MGKSKTIQEHEDKHVEFQDYLKIYEKDIILDDMYEDCLNSGMDFVQTFHIINEIRTSKKFSNKTKQVIIIIPINN